MITVSSKLKAYTHFQPYAPNRDSETVTIDSSEGVWFFHWDKAQNYFNMDDGRGTVYGFPGPHIDRMGVRNRVFFNPEPAPEGVRLQ